jgi:transcriptional regulator with XRE-family HTH domain
LNSPTRDKGILVCAARCGEHIREPSGHAGSAAFITRLMHASMKNHRRRWALTQRELSHLLLGISKSAVSRYEAGTCFPPLKIVVALEVVFGLSPKSLYPHLYAEVEDGVMRQAADFSVRLEGATGTRAEIKQQLLADIIDRSTSVAPA